MPAHAQQRLDGQAGATGAPAAQVPWLSILIPVYNVAPYLRECLDSVLSQAAPDVEILLVDDGSTDGSARICAEIRERHAGVRLLCHERNRGLSAARNTLLEAAAGRYVWFVDSDDRMLPGALATLRAILTAQEPDMVLCDYRERARVRSGFAGAANVLGRGREALVHGVFASRRTYSWSRIVRRELWGADLRFPVGRCFEDIATTPWLCLRAASYYYSPEPWIDYRVRDDSIMAAAVRYRRSFDRRMNDDLAAALGGFRAAAAAVLPRMAAPTRLAIAEFCARDYAGIGWRLLWAHLTWGARGPFFAELRRYRVQIERESPAGFGRVFAAALRRFRLKLCVQLGVMLVLGARRRTARE